MRGRQSIIELPKTAEIQDKYGNIWFTVILDRDPIPPNWNEFDEYYIIEVVNNRHPDGEDVVILRYPDRGQRLADYRSACQKFDEYVRNYESVMKASTRDIQKMDVFSSKTDYRKSDAKCCATCQFCRQVPKVNDFYYGITGKLECWCEDNQEDYRLDRHRHCDYGYHHFIGQPTRHMENERLPIHPQVEPFDVCDKYMKRKRPLTPVPGQSMSEFVDMRMGHRLDDRISSRVSAYLSGDAIVQPVLCAVTKALSSDQASAILETPVANIMGNSTIVQNKTVNVIENALSNGRMQESFDTAAAQSYQNEKIVQAMVEPVSVILLSPEVSGVVRDVALSGVKISAIYGGSEIKDDNGDGIPDDIVFGGMGA